jgi:hypothetical protein
MKRRLGMWIAVVIGLASAGCGRSGIIAYDPEGGRIEFDVDVTSTAYTSWEFCWEGTLDTAQGSTPGDDDTARTFQNIPHQSLLRSPVSQELRAGTWRIRVRLTGFNALGSAIRIDLNDCTNTPGDLPTVYEGKTTRVVLNEGFTTCEWYTPSSTFTPNMGEGVVQPCSPGVSRLAVPRRLG